ncbi:MAG TPA: nitrate- and nitrite sensing domain-containing protein [Streptosporangiaceae bacterium]|nr:nitrate- and nitrite sensing domain-containing protein [Streptosporangiaceae bacterium]
MTELSPAVPVGPAGGPSPGPSHGQSEEAAAAGSALALRNWLVAWRLIALIVIPLVAGMVFAGLRVDVAAGSATTFGRVEQLAELGQQVSALAEAMENERDRTAVYIADGRPLAELAGLRTQYGVTDAQAAKVTALAQGVGPAFPAQTRAAVAAVLARITDLPDLRSYAAGSQAPALPVIIEYSLANADLLALDDDIAQEGGNAALIASVRTLGSLSRMKDQASEQQAIVATSLATGQIGPQAMGALTTAQAQQAADLASFDTSATLGERQAFNDIVAGPMVDQAQALEQHAIVAGATGGTLGAGVSQQWDADMFDTITRMRTAEAQLVASIVAQARVLHQGAARSAVLTGGAALAVLIFVLLATVIIARSMVRPLRLLKAGALEIAGVRLPSEVRELSQAGSADGAAEVEPIGVHSTDEIGQVARAFDRVHREALRLAADEARLRGSVSAMFVSLSRRSQSLLERQLRLIDSLELGEEDPERLGSLFRMDHLATRMRRHSENLLVLAGHEPPRRQVGPAPLVDVVRAAASEIEQYDRVALTIQPGLAVAGNAVTDIVHLLAELLENATMFSAKTTQVIVTGHAHVSGGVLLGVTDSGMGMTDQQFAQLNLRLENPPAADLAVARHMGLFAVAHLAARHGIAVRLHKPPAGGVAAQVHLPGALITGEPAAAPQPAAPGTRAPAWAQPSARAARSPLARGSVVVPDSPPHAAPPPPHAAPPPPYAAAPPPHVVLPKRPAPVAVPAPEGSQYGAALPIFDSVESDWFRARGRGLPRRASDPGTATPMTALPGTATPMTALPMTALPMTSAPASPEAAVSWSAPGDEGWRAAEVVLAPVSAGVTAAGLPVRTPRANLVPGSAGERAPRPARPARIVTPAESAEAARNRLAGFQRGSRRARATVPVTYTPDAPQ